VNRFYESLEGLCHEHESLLSALESLDVGRAEQACNEHLDGARERLLLLRSQLPMGDRDQHSPGDA
jgi:DNA-binding GntR family transcriptional regulator